MNIKVLLQEVVLNHGQNLTIDMIHTEDVIEAKDSYQYSKMVASEYAKVNGYQPEDLVVYLVYSDNVK